MQSFTVDRKNANSRIEKYIQTMYPALSYGTLQKTFRKKDVKVNGIRVGRDYVVTSGDVVELYITDDLLAGAVSPAGKKAAGFTVVYEDDNILIVNKDQGIPVHPDKEQSRETLIDLAREYLAEKDHESANRADFQPSLCHRLDRNTGGLVLIAKNRTSHEILLEKLEAREIRKYYQCLVKGRMEKQEERLKAFLWKDAGKSRVFVSDRKNTGSLEIITVYKVLEYDPTRDISRLEVELVTGRTHQIRAHLAFAGHPILGDGKYGTNEINRTSGFKHQALWACKLRFAFSGKTALDYLNGKEFFVEPGFNKT